MHRLSEILFTRIQPRFDALRSPLFRLVSAEGERRPIREAFVDQAHLGAAMWLVTTCDRPASCEQLVGGLGDVARKAGEKPLIVVLCDACASDYGDVRDALERDFEERAIFVETTRRLGKREFWRIHQLAFDLTRMLAPSYVFCVQDDVELAPGWFDEAWSIIRGLSDPDFAALSLHSALDDEPEGRWIRFVRRPSSCDRAWLTQWLDLPAFLAAPRFYDALGHRVRPISRLRWAWDRERSSGVARQITRRLFAHDANVYQVARALAFHGSQPSLMNPEARARRPMDNRARR